MLSLKKINNIDNTITRILFAPLDWGLGHTTRCLPIIKAFQEAGANVTVACNENQARLLQAEIPDIGILHLKGYELRYSKSKAMMWMSIASQVPKILTAIKSENKWLNFLLGKEQFDVVISDNRFGLSHPSVFSIFITHQLSIRIPFSKWVEDLFRKWNYRFIQRFDECWIPDFENEPNLSGALSHSKPLPALKIKYMGLVSRFRKSPNTPVESQKLVVLISGPEPQRTIFENRIIFQLKNWDGTATVVRGLPSESTSVPSFNNILFYNHLPASLLNEEMNKAGYIIARSGYSTIMDIVALQKKSILIPTPGQTEQEYLAEWLMKKKYCLAFDQKKFSLIEAIMEAENFDYADLSGFRTDRYLDLVNDFMQQHFKETKQANVSSKI